jgi:hypothetical protein
MKKKASVELVPIRSKIETFHQIECTYCEGTSAFYNAEMFSPFEVVDKLETEGWVATKENVYCPVCAKTFKLK